MELTVLQCLAALNAFMDAEDEGYAKSECVFAAVIAAIEAGHAVNQEPNAQQDRT